MTKLKLGFALALLCLATALVVQHETQIRLQRENDNLRQQIAQLQSEKTELSKRAERVKPLLRLPAPRLAAARPESLPADDLLSTNLYSRFQDHRPHLTAAQVEAYLQANGRKPLSLLAAYRSSGDPAFLKEAMDKYPNDPQVAFEAAFDKDLSPEQKRQWLTNFEQGAPANALPDYLLALTDFNSGHTDQAIQELTAASAKGFDDYTLQRVQADKEAYLSAGYSVAEAERVSLSWLELPQLSQLKQVGQDMVALADTYRQSGDAASAQAALQMAVNLGQRYDNSDAPANAALISQLVGIAIERMGLNAMDPAAAYGPTGLTAQDRLNQLDQQRAIIRELDQQAEPLFPTLSDQEWLNYTDRRLLFGEAAALRWVTEKYGLQH